MTSETSTTKRDVPGTTDTFASVRFAGTTLDPAVLTTLMGVEPSLSYAKGDTYVVGARRTLQMRRVGLWLLSSEGVVDSQNLSDHEAFVASALQNARVGLAAFLRDRTVALTVALYWYGASDASLPTADTKLARLVERLGGTLELEIDVNEADHYVA